MQKKEPKSTANNHIVFTEEEFLAMEKQLEQEKEDVLEYINSGNSKDI